MGNGLPELYTWGTASPVVRKHTQEISQWRNWLVEDTYTTGVVRSCSSLNLPYKLPFLLQWSQSWSFVGIWSRRLCQTWALWYEFAFAPCKPKEPALQYLPAPGRFHHSCLEGDPPSFSISRAETNLLHLRLCRGPRDHNIACKKQAGPLEMKRCLVKRADLQKWVGADAQMAQWYTRGLREVHQQKIAYYCLAGLFWG